MIDVLRSPCCNFNMPMHCNLLTLIFDHMTSKPFIVVLQEVNRLTQYEFSVTKQSAIFMHLPSTNVLILRPLNCWLCKFSTCDTSPLAIFFQPWRMCNHWLISYNTFCTGVQNPVILIFDLLTSKWQCKLSVSCKECVRNLNWTKHINWLRCWTDTLTFQLSITGLIANLVRTFPPSLTVVRHYVHHLGIFRVWTVWGRNHFNATCSKLLLFEGFSTILV